MGQGQEPNDVGNGKVPSPWSPWMLRPAAALQAGAQLPPAPGSSRMLIPCQGPSGDAAQVGEQLSGAPGKHTGVLAGYPGLRAWARAPHSSWSCFSLNGSSFSASPASIRDCPGELRGNGWSSSGAGAREARQWPQHRPQPWKKGLGDDIPPRPLSSESASCFIHIIPNKHSLPLGFSP